MTLCRPGEEREVEYTEDRWLLLKRLREEAIKIMDVLSSRGIKPFIHGSVARGDVHEGSDIDIVIPKYVSPPMIDSSLEAAGYTIYKKVIIQATPHSTPKVYYYLDELETKLISYPLRELSSNELYFYRFGGQLDLDGLRAGRRTVGVDKRLMLITPLSIGHKEECIRNRAGYAAKRLGIPEAIVNERIYMLGKREIYGRTGVFLEYVLRPGEDVVTAVKELAITNKMFRRALYGDR